MVSLHLTNHLVYVKQFNLWLLAPQGFYLNTFDCVAKTWKWEGLRGFYSGIGSPLTGQMFFRAVSFSTFHYSVSCISNQSHKTSSLQYFLAGGFTGFVISILEVCSNK